MIFYSNSSDPRSELAWKLAGARSGARPDSAWHFPDDLGWGRQKSRYCDRTTLRHTKLKPPTICARLWRAVVPDHRAKPFTIKKVFSQADGPASHTPVTPINFPSFVSDPQKNVIVRQMELDIFPKSPR